MDILVLRHVSRIPLARKLPFTDDVDAFFDNVSVNGIVLPLQLIGIGLGLVS